MLISNNLNLSRINKYKPARVMIHSANEKLTVGHINYWIAIFLESKINFSILTRDINSYKKLIKQFPKYSILYAKNPLDVEEAISRQNKLEKIFYTTNMAKNIHLLRFNHVKHIFIGTENSDQLSIVDKSYRAYDEVWVSSQSQIDKFRDTIGNTGHLKFPIVGKPQLKKIFLISLKKRKRDSILFLPDSKNVNNSFLPYLGEILLNVINYSVFLHLTNKLYIQYTKQFSLDKSLDISLFQSKELFSDIALRSDFIVLDINHIKVSLLAYNIPLIVYIPEEEKKDELELDIPLEALYFFSNHKELLEIIDKLEEEDALKEKRDEVTEYLLGKEETLEDRFFTEIN